MTIIIRHVCQLCGLVIEGERPLTPAIMKHRWIAHRDAMLAAGQKGREGQQDTIRKRKEMKAKTPRAAAPVQAPQPVSRPAPKLVKAEKPAKAVVDEELPPDPAPGDDAEDDSFEGVHPPSDKEVFTPGNGHKPLGDAEENPEPTGKQKAKPKTLTLAKTLGEANILSFTPKEFKVSSTLFHMVKHITEVEPEWGPWPEMDESDWLDTFFYHVMLKFGYVLGGYQKVRREAKDDSAVSV